MQKIFRPQTAARSSEERVLLGCSLSSALVSRRLCSRREREQPPSVLMQPHTTLRPGGAFSRRLVAAIAQRCDQTCRQWLFPSDRVPSALRQGAPSSGTSGPRQGSRQSGGCRRRGGATGGGSA